MTDLLPAPFDLTDRVALVTGGGTGIGEATAHVLAQFGAECVLASRKLENLERVAKDVANESGRRCLAVRADVREEDDVEAMIERTITEFGRIDILVNNAGGSYLFPLDFQLAGIWRYSSPLPFSVTSATVVFARPEPRGSRRGDDYRSLNVRLSKAFRLGGNRTATGFIGSGSFVDTGYQVDRYDFLDLLPASLGRLLRGAYAAQLRHAPHSWEALLNLSGEGGVSL